MLITYSSSFDDIQTLFPMLVVLLCVLAANQYFKGYFTTFQRF